VKYGVEAGVAIKAHGPHTARVYLQGVRVRGREKLLAKNVSGVKKNYTRKTDVSESYFW